jgi:precorrin-6B methylase 2
MNPTSVDYVFGGTETELERLLAQAADLKPESTWLLDEIGIEPGWTAADIGCGPIGIIDLLSERVGPDGTVVGIERERRFADMAQAQITKRGLPNVSIVRGDAMGAVDIGRFDLVHERLVLINMPEANRHALVDQMVALARPGGTLAVESWDRASLACHPEHHSWHVLNEAYVKAIRPTNGDGTSGRTLPWLLRSAGVTGVRTKVHVRAVDVGDTRRLHRLKTFRAAKAPILTSERLSEQEFEAHWKAASDHLADPTTLLIDQLFVQAWGRTAL